MLYFELTCQHLKGFYGVNHEYPQSQRAHLFLGSLPGVRGGEQGAAGFPMTVVRGAIMIIIGLIDNVVALSTSLSIIFHKPNTSGTI